ncbi:MAG: integrase [Haliea sp.]|nr:integrase [Haliea sp.]|tara:strand:- start:6988 stop:8199 length:1212 start_codon:yes stop_codon:yes gene_type:complete
MDQRKPLTHARQADAAKPEARPYTLKAGDGLFLKVMPNGTKKWVWRYFYLKKAKSLSMGLYPAVGLAEAKAARDEARKLLAQGEDPSQRRKDEKASALLEQENTFKAVAEEWQARQTDKAEATRTKSAWLLSFPIADFGHRPIRDITPVMVLNTCRKFENQDKLETAKRIKIKCSQVFRYAVATGRAESDPTRDLNGALKPPQVKHRAAITNPAEMAQLLRDIDGYSGHPQVQAALQISPLVFVRPGELRSARWADVDLEAAEWRFTPPKTRNQTQVELIVPLARQAVAILRNLQRITGRREHVFHSYGKSRHLSESAVLNALRRLGYSGDVMTGHGFRAMAKTVMLEVLKLPDQYIELQLGHKIRDPNGGAYHRAKFLEDRKEMMQVWADYLDKLRAGTTVT